MTTLTHPNQLHPDWLDALSILRRAVEEQDITKLWKTAWPEFETHNATYLVRFEGDHISQRPVIVTQQEFSSLPKIERVEILTHAACRTWFNRYYVKWHNDQERVDYELLCRRAGCYWVDTPSIRERWRLIDFYQPAHLLPNACFEDRPRCKVCRQPVATDAGATQTITLPQSNNVVKTSYRPDIHEECMRFAHRVMVPLVKGEPKP
jgi:hypothetical protein